MILPRKRNQCELVVQCASLSEKMNGLELTKNGKRMVAPISIDPAKDLGQIMLPNARTRGRYGLIESSLNPTGGEQGVILIAGMLTS